MDLLATPGTIILAVLALGILIIVHEGGHFLVARLSGMRVDRFSIGFGPKVWSFKRGETIYQIAAIPLGGFVQIAGLNPGEEGLAADDPRAFPNRPVWQRLATIFAGPGTNYIFAVLMMLIAFLSWGLPVTAPVVDLVQDGKPAAAAGFKAGDELVSINGTKLGDQTEVAPLISASKGAPLTIEVLRNGKPETLHVTAAKDGSEYRIGIQIGGKDTWEPAPAATRVKMAFVFPIQYSKFILTSLVQGGFGQILREGSGPIGIGKAMAQQFKLGFRHGWRLVAAISIYLGLFNLLPLPGLDGGRLVFLGWEAISRRRVNQRIEQTVHMVGVLALLLLIVIVSFKNDLGLGRWFHH